MSNSCYLTNVTIATLILIIIIIFIMIGVATGIDIGVNGMLSINANI